MEAINEKYKNKEGERGIKGAFTLLLLRDKNSLANLVSQQDVLSEPKSNSRCDYQVIP